MEDTYFISFISRHALLLGILIAQDLGNIRNFWVESWPGLRWVFMVHESPINDKVVFCKHQMKELILGSVTMLQCVRISQHVLVQ